MAENLLPGRYAVGAASVDAGGTIVTPTGASWTDNVWDDDLFFLPSQPLVPPQRVESVNDDGEIVLAYPWPGAAATEEPYEVRYVGIIERSTAQSRRVLEQLGDVKAWYDIIVVDDASRLALESPTSPLRTGYRVLVKDDGVIWAKKTSAYGDWIGPVEFKGDTGNKGWSPVFGVVADGAMRVLQLAAWVGGEGSAPAGAGKYVGAAGLVDDIAQAIDVRGEGFEWSGVYNAASAYPKGSVTRLNGTSFIASQAVPVGEQPSSAYPPVDTAFWAVLAAKGQDGTGTGDMVGPADSANDEIVVFSGTTGKLTKRGGKTIAEIASTGSVPLGTPMPMISNTLPGGYLWLEGGTYDPLVYPEFAAYMVSGGYVSGQLPDWRNRVPRGLGGLTGAIGPLQEDAFQGHYHATSGISFLAVGPTGTQGGTSGGQAYVSPVVQGPTTDGANGAPRTASETRVKAVIVRWAIKAYGAINDAGTADLVAIEQAIANGMIRKDQDQNAQGLSSAFKINILKNTLQAWEKIGRASSATGVAWFEWSGLKAFEALRIRAKIRSTVAASLPAIQMAIEGGSWRAGASDYHGATQYSTSTSVAAVATAGSSYAGFVAITGANNAVGFDYNMNVHIAGMNEAIYTHVDMEAGYLLSVGTAVVQARSHYITQTLVVDDAMRLFMTSGSIIGWATIEGIRA